MFLSFLMISAVALLLFPKLRLSCTYESTGRVFRAEVVFLFLHFEYFRDPGHPASYRVFAWTRLVWQSMEESEKFDLQYFARSKKFRLFLENKQLIGDTGRLVFNAVKRFFLLFRDWRLCAKLDYWLTDHKLLGESFALMSAFSHSMRRIRIMPYIRYTEEAHLDYNLRFDLNLRLIGFVRFITGLIFTGETFRLGWWGLRYYWRKREKRVTGNG
ncbi:MAG: hypothetical protein PHQ23_10410 [Candidatus Wallbacteria bacterium]|nr:hypothetical protein [Candidatus Wallbacteria bacterium]